MIDLQFNENHAPEFLEFDFNECPKWVQAWVRQQPWHDKLRDAALDAGFTGSRHTSYCVPDIAESLGIHNIFVFTIGNPRDVIVRIPNNAETTLFILTHINQELTTD